jgi:hypothetical protein
MRFPSIAGIVGCFALSALTGCGADTKPTINPNPIKADPKFNDLASAPKGNVSPAAKRAAARRKTLSDKNQVEP